MKYFEAVEGNSALLHRLASDIETNSLSHAYILEGPRGCGRHTVALSAIAATECKSGDSSPCGNCPQCRKILGHKSPDVITVGLEDDRATLGVDAVRRIKEDICIFPNELKHKAYIIENADLMTVQAQNALLLSLEEPPEYVLFFLLCESSSELLETVRSRAPVLRFERLPRETVYGYLTKTDKRARKLAEEDPDTMNALLFVANGSIGYALELLDPKRARQVFDGRAAASEILSALSTSSYASALSVIGTIGSKRADALEKLTYLRYALRDLILLKKSDRAPLCFFEDADYAAELSTHFTSTGLLSLYDAAEDASDELDRNANVRLTLMNMLQKAGLI